MKMYEKVKQDYISNIFENIDWLKREILEIKDNEDLVNYYQAKLVRCEDYLSNIYIEEGDYDEE